MPDEIKVFISYQREERLLAERLSRRLRRYVPPRAAELGDKRIAVVRDEERFIGNPDLRDMLRREAQSVDKLVLLCSGTSARSEYVDLEVDTFCRHRSLDDIVFVRANGDFPHILPAALNGKVDTPAYIDMQSVDRRRFRLESLRVIATVYGISYDKLRRVDDAHRRRRRSLAAIAGLAAAVALGSSYLVASTPADAWIRVPQPDAREQFEFRDGVLPVRDVAISRQDPTLILYKGLNPQWPDGPLPPTFRVEPEDGAFEFFRSIEALSSGSGRLPNPAAIVRFSVSLGERRLAGGEVSIELARDLPGAIRFLRSARLDIGPADHGDASLTLERVLLPAKDANPLDIGFVLDAVIEALPGVERHDEFAVVGNIDDRITEQRYEAEFFVESAVDPYDSWVEYLDEPLKIFGSRRAESIVIAGSTLEAVEHDPDTWRRITGSAHWATYQPNAVTNAGSFFDDDVEWTGSEPLPGKAVLDMAARIPGNDDPAALAALILDHWSADFMTSVTHYAAPVGGAGMPAELIELAGIQDRQGDGFHPDGSRRWLIRVGQSPWRPLQLPSDRLLSIWSLAADDVMVLTADQGFFRSRDAGNSWSDANYNETGFTAGTAVRPIVVPEHGSMFALIDRGSRSDPENPLLRLTRRSLFERWRFGLARLLGGDSVIAG